VTDTGIERSAVGLRSERGPILLSVMLATGLVAIDSTILATAVPSVVEDLGGFSQFPWLFSIYLLAQAVTVPLYGKFADQVGRKPMMMLGISIFLAASILCGFAWSMVSLIVFRALQGLGAGAVLPMGQTIIGDVYSVAERARVTGYVAGVWAASSVIGPTLGGVFSDYVSWRWIFFVNIPVAIAAMLVLHRSFHESVERKRHQIDYTGAALLAVGASMLILGLLEGGVAWAWNSPASIAVLSISVVLLLVFGYVESRAAEPILPLWVFRRRMLNGANATSLCVGVILIGLTSYVPLYAQGVLGHGAVVAGFAVAALTLGWPIAASLSGRIYLRVGFRDCALFGSLFAIAGSAILLTVTPDSSVWRLAFACWVIGLGMGFILSGADRRAVHRGLADPGPGHRYEPVRPLGRQRGRRRRVRRDRQRRGLPARRRRARPGAPPDVGAGVRHPRRLPGVRGRRGRHRPHRAGDPAPAADDADHLTVPVQRNRVGSNSPMGCLVAPSRARSASTSPTTGTNLKP